MKKSIPRIIISALKGGSGKTILSLGIIAALKEKGYRVASFKKGPDFIDSSWLSIASERDCYNLDSFMMSESQIVRSFVDHSAGSDIAVIEGNRGLYDGLDIEGCCSTAELGKTLDCPVVLIVDVTMSTRTVAALVLGCQQFDRELNLQGVILNRVAGARQEALIKNSVERYCSLPVIGSIPKLKTHLFPERHMGLVPHQEREHADRAITWARSIVEKHIDLDALVLNAKGADPVEPPPQTNTDPRPPTVEGMITGQDRFAAPRIGFIHDKAFWFYYPENLKSLKNRGAELIPIDSIRDATLPDLEALYIGGGFPETQAQALADNETFRTDMKKAIEEGLPVYAECGGLMYLGEHLLIKENAYPMVGAFPIDFQLEKKPQGHGYTIMEVIEDNLYYSKGDILKGHEFHYSKPLMRKREDIKTIFKVRRGFGLDGTHDGLVKKNLIGTYTHLHTGGYPRWSDQLFRIALRFQQRDKRGFLSRFKKKH